MKEIWKPIKGHEDSHEVSNQGRIRTRNRVVVDCNGFKRRYRPRILKLQLTKDGYFRVHLCKGKCPLVHRLVAQAFLPPDDPTKQVNHLSFVKTDNAVENLAWTSRAENHRHAVVGGRYHAMTNPRRRPGSLTPEKVAAIRGAYAEGETFSAIATRFGLGHKGNAEAICTGTAWSLPPSSGPTV